MEQLSDEQLLVSLDPEMNSIAIVMKHMAGNMRSRWTDLLTSDGEKPNRDRDSEFEQAPSTRAELLKLWNDGWDRVFSALEPLSDSAIEQKLQLAAETFLKFRKLPFAQRARWMANAAADGTLCVQTAQAADSATITSLLVHAGFAVQQVLEEQPTLEALFLNATGGALPGASS